VACLASVCLSSLLHTTTAFVGRHQQQHRAVIPTPLDAKASKTGISSDASAADNAAALTDFMAKAHEEKIKAMARVEDKYKGQITELEEKIAELEVLAKQTTPTSGNSFAFPATNKDLTDKVEAYRTFISDYIVNAQEQKASAVKAAESKVTAKFEAIIDQMKSE